MSEVVAYAFLSPCTLVHTEFFLPFCTASSTQEKFPAGCMQEHEGISESKNLNFQVLLPCEDASMSRQNLTHDLVPPYPQAQQQLITNIFRGQAPPLFQHRLCCFHRSRWERDVPSNHWRLYGCWCYVRGRDRWTCLLHLHS